MEKRLFLDCSNGASYKIAKKVFKEKGAKLYMIGANPSGLNINRGCGALHTEKLQEMVKKQGADFGFAFDGDSDRLIAVDECGKIITGDELVYVLPCIINLMANCFHQRLLEQGTQTWVLKRP